jgi:hypothetical protein
LVLALIFFLPPFPAFYILRQLVATDVLEFPCVDLAVAVWGAHVWTIAKKRSQIRRLEIRIAATGNAAV